MLVLLVSDLTSSLSSALTVSKGIDYVRHHYNLLLLILIPYFKLFYYSTYILPLELNLQERGYLLSVYHITSKIENLLQKQTTRRTLATFLYTYQSRQTKNWVCRS